MVTPRHRLQVASVLVFGLIATIAGPAAAAAQGIYGRIRGTVTDSLGPIAGVRISLAGTGFVAVTDQDGAYAIEHVPAGEYTVRAVMVRRSPEERAGVRVPSEGTVIADVRYGGGRILVHPAGDELTSRTLLEGALLSRIPIDDNRQGLGLASGVVLRGADLGIAEVPDLSIRGSGADQTAVFVDGAPARFETAGMSQLALGANAISEVSVVTGTQRATVAEARGGSISYVTRAGGPSFDAGLSAGTDGPFSKSSTVGFNRFDGYAGGPMPGLRNLTWFVSGAVYGQASQYRGAGADTVPTFGLAGVDTVVSYTDQSGTSYTAAVPRFAQVSGSCGQIGSGASAQARDIQANYGLACQGLRLNLDWTTSRRTQAKLLYTYGQGSSISLTGIASDFQQRDYPGADMADNLLYTGSRTHSALAVLNWTHRLTEPLRGALTLSGNLSIGSDGYQSGPLDPTSELATEDPAGGIEFSMLRFAGLAGLPLPLTDAVIQQIRSNTFRPPYYGQYGLSPYQEFRFNPYGVSSGWPTSGFGGEATVTSETRVNGRLGAEWRATPELALTVGGDFSRTDLSYYDAPVVTGFGLNAFLAHPRRTGLFAEARLDEGALQVEAGARGDRYVTGSDFPIYPGRIFSNPAWSTGDTSYAARMSRVLEPGRVQTLVTPQLRMAFSVDASTTARAGFSQQVEVPPYALLFANVNSDLAVSNAEAFGRDVSYVKSTLIEGGIRHAFSSGLTLDVSLFDKTHLMPYTFQSQPVYDPYLGGTPGQPNTSLLLLSPTGDSHALGGDVRLEWGAGRAVSGSAAYSIEVANLGLVSQVPGVSLPDVTTQAIAGTLTLRVPDGWSRGSAFGSAARGVSAVLAGRLTSGEPYTPAFFGGAGIITPPNNFIFGTGSLDVEHLPWTNSLDLRVAKTFAVRGTRWTAYAEARNLLNLSNLIAVFNESGTDQDALFRANLITPQISSLEQDAGALWVTRPVTVNGVQQMLQGIDLSDCSRYPPGIGGSRGVVDCLALRQVEARWGNGDQFYDMNEINRALNAWYDAFYGTWLFHGPARTARVGIEIAF